MMVAGLDKRFDVYPPWYTPYGHPSGVQICSWQICYTIIRRDSGW